MVDLADPYPYVPVKNPWTGGTRWRFLSWADIPSATDPKRTYLRRLRIVQTPWFAFYLHWIFLPDDDRDPHDHPFAFWSWIVRGGYTERLWRVVPAVMKPHQPVREKTWGRFSLHKMRQDEAHMIDHLVPRTITFVIAGRKTRDWGFYPDREFVPWQTYNNAKYDEHA